jgi:hypothetical protein
VCVCGGGRGGGGAAHEVLIVSSVGAGLVPRLVAIVGCACAVAYRGCGGARGV